MALENISIKQIAHDSIEYLHIVALRQRILREPLGLRYTSEQLDNETDEFIFAAYDGSTIIGCLHLKPVEKNVMQMRQVAVDESLQGKGIGKILVQRAEQFARERDYQKIILHSRNTAIPFYEKLGYSVIGDEYIEVTIPHHTMHKGIKN
jgi:N-acetylglutamate synthase-like GNAT family acetyltransferase